MTCRKKFREEREGKEKTVKKVHVVIDLTYKYSSEKRLVGCLV